MSSRLHLVEAHPAASSRPCPRPAPQARPAAPRQRAGLSPTDWLTATIGVTFVVGNLYCWFVGLLHILASVFGG